MEKRQKMKLLKSGNCGIGLIRDADPNQVSLVPGISKTNYCFFFKSILTLLGRCPDSCEFKIFRGEDKYLTGLRKRELSFQVIALQRLKFFYVKYGCGSTLQ